MSFWLWGVAVSLLCGTAVSVLNFLLSRYALKNRPQLFSLLTAVRMLLNIACLALTYFVAPYTPWDFTYLLIGVAVGLTLPTFFFTASLIRALKSGEKEREVDEHHG